MVRIAARVPDPGRLTPWRFVLYRGDARVEVGKYLADLAEEREGPLTEQRREQELKRFARAPLVIG
ncbi:nitroreductase family protein, partial [Mycobacterium tuberculosis]|nr:nitroreductase family protein [Mycobacterium tuberculosis]